MPKRWIATLLGLALLAGPATVRAEKPAANEPLTAAGYPVRLVEMLDRVGFRQRAAGMVLVFGGAALAIVGVGLIRYGTTPGGGERGAAPNIAGLNLVTHGVGAIITGAVLWPLGMKKIAEAKRFGLSPAPAGSLGAGLGVSF